MVESERMALDLHGWRNTRGLTQVEAAQMLGVSQTYLSLLESGSRPLTSDLRSRLQTLRNSPKPHPARTETSFRPQLAALGYSGFRHVDASRRRAAPGTVLLRALLYPDLDARVCEALPWVARSYASEIDWEWLVRQAKLHDFQNRLGFLVELAGTADEPMAHARSELEAARLLAEATFCWDSMPEATRRWMRQNRSPEASHWNVVTRLRAEDLADAE
jgi:transcriptional regulator with XRE-family HTH domain